MAGQVSLYNKNGVATAGEMDSAEWKSRVATAGGYTAASVTKGRHEREFQGRETGWG